MTDLFCHLSDTLFHLLAIDPIGISFRHLYTLGRLKC
jgi:hypothetical protein